MNKVYYSLIFSLVLFFTYGILTKENKDITKKEKRVSCQKKTVTFEKIGNKNFINNAIELLQTNNYLIQSRIEKAIYMESKILDFTSTKELDLILKNTIAKYSKKSVKNKNKLLIDYYILENDKEDKGKKSTNCKLYAGYLVFEFILDGKLVYKIQTDYMKGDTSDIPNRVECVIKSFVSLHHQ